MPLVTCGADGSTRAEIVEQINNNTTENVFNVDSMTDILGIDFTIYKTTNVRGYYNPSDGGGDLFNYDSTIDKSTANAGTIIDPSVSLSNQGNGIGSGCWVRQYSESISVLWFGADKNGLIDSYDAINRADLFASKNAFTGTNTYGNKVGSPPISDVYFPIGSYRATQQINKHYATNWRSYGGNLSSLYVEKRGAGAVIRCEHDGICIKVDNTYNKGTFDFKFAKGSGFENISAIGDLSYFPNAKGIVYQAGCKGQNLTNVIVSHFRTNFEADNCGEFFFKEVYSYFAKFSGNFLECADSWFDDCHFGSPEPSVDSGGGTDPSTVVAGGNAMRLSSCSNFTFDNTRLQVQYQGDNLYMTDCYRVIFDGCIIDQSDDDAMQLNYGMRDIKFSDCSFFGSGDVSVLISNANVTITSVSTVDNTFTYSDVSTQFRGATINVISTGVLPSPLIADTKYYTRKVTSSTFTLHPTHKDALKNTNIIDITDIGSGTITVAQQQDISFDSCSFDDTYLLQVSAPASAPVNNLKFNGCNMFEDSTFLKTAITSNVVDLKTDIDGVSKTITKSSSSTIFPSADGDNILVDTAAVDITLADTSCYIGQIVTVFNDSVGTINILNHDTTPIETLAAGDVARYKLLDDRNWRKI